MEVKPAKNEEAIYRIVSRGLRKDGNVINHSFSGIDVSMVLNDLLWKTAHVRYNKMSNYQRVAIMGNMMQLRGSP